MKNKLAKLSIMLIICFLVQNIFYINNVLAANGTFRISLSKNTANQGDRVTLTITAENAFGKLDISATNATIEGGTSVFLQNDSKQVTIIPNTAGKNVNVTVKPSTDGIGDQDENPITDVRTATIRVNAPSNNSGTSNSGDSNSGNSGNSGNSENNGGSATTSKSSNANLKNLGITPNDFTGFRANTTTYNVTVPYDVESVNVYAKTQDSNATVTGTGTKRLKEGSNSLQVVVTAEDGTTTKTYTINVVRTSEEEEMTPNVIDEETEESPESLRLTAISLQNDLNLSLSPTFDSEVFEYTVEVESDLEKLELSGIPNVNGAKVTIEGNEKLENEENIITITVSADGYDDVVYKVKVIKKVEDKQEEEEQETELVEPVDLDNSKARMRIIIISAIVAFIIIAIIVIIVLKRKKENKRLYSSYYDYYNDYPDESKKMDTVEETDNDEYDSTQEVKTRKNLFEDDMSDSDTEIPEGYTAEIEQDTEYEEKPRRKRGKGKHF